MASIKWFSCGNLLRLVDDKIKALQADFAAWKSLSLSTDVV
jgi:hypothetical protein